MVERQARGASGSGAAEGAGPRWVEVGAPAWVVRVAERDEEFALRRDRPALLQVLMVTYAAAVRWGEFLPYPLMCSPGSDLHCGCACSSDPLQWRCGCDDVVALWPAAPWPRSGLGGGGG